MKYIIYTCNILYRCECLLENNRWRIFQSSLVKYRWRHLPLFSLNLYNYTEHSWTWNIRETIFKIRFSLGGTLRTIYFKINSIQELIKGYIGRYWQEYTNYCSIVAHAFAPRRGIYSIVLRSTACKSVLFDALWGLGRDNYIWKSIIY